MSYTKNSFYILVALAWLSTASAQEQIRFGAPVRAESMEAAGDSLPLITTLPPKELATDAEIVLISGYEPANKRAAGTTVNVEVNRPNSKVLLVLSSYEKINWNVTALSSTKISGIIVSGYQKPTVTTTIQTQGYLFRMPYAYETENKNFTGLMSSLNALFGIEKLDVFRGSYAIPLTVRISAIDPPRIELTEKGPTPVRPGTNFEFNLLATDYSWVRWTLTGPVENDGKVIFGEGRVALSGSGKVIYKLNGEKLEITDRSGGQSNIAALPPNFPKFSWATDLAYDTKRDIVSVVSLGGEGFLYRFDTKAQRWIDFRSLKDIDIYSLSYDQKMDRYIAWTDEGSLVFISGEGDALFSKKVISRLAGFGRLYDRGNGQAPRVLIAPNGDDIALIYMGGKNIKRIWYYNVKSEQALLTY